MRIASINSGSCAFCGISDGQAPASIVYRDEHVVAFRDIHPVAPIHVLVAPVRHIPSLNDLQIEEQHLVARLVSVARQIADQEGLYSDGYRLVINTGPQAGQSVFHLHVHLVGGRPMHWPPG